MGTGDSYDSRNEAVEKALFDAATGHVIRLKKPVKVKKETNRPGEGKQVAEQMRTVVEEVYVEPKITAQMFWLKCRMPETWGTGERTAEPEMPDAAETCAALVRAPVPTRGLEDADDQLCPAE